MSAGATKRTVFRVAVAALFAIAIGMRLHHLGLPFDRDSYDEGVYWQSLRAMSAGHGLYGAIFYSQPPLFLLSTYPIYALLGASLFSARLGIALVSLVGLVGALITGKALSGRPGALAALLLACVNPLFLMQSQTIQAEASSVAFSFLAMGLALCWWKCSDGRRGRLLAAGTGVTVALSIMCKLLGVALLVPVTLIAIQSWWEKGPKSRLPVLCGSAAFVFSILLLSLPFFGSLHALWSSVVTFHLDAGRVLSGRGQWSFSVNAANLQAELTMLLTLAAVFGSAAALWRRDWRVLPLMGWLFATTFLLLRQVPLFQHHLVSLVPPLVALSVLGISEHAGRSRALAATSAALLFIVVTAVVNVRADILYYKNADARSGDQLAQLEARVAADLNHAIAPGQQVVTDAQFVAALASRDTPPGLVDTSMVRIATGSLTLSQLESVTSEPQVHAVLFFTGRFSSPDVKALHSWVAERFHLLMDYGNNRELWVR